MNQPSIISPAYLSELEKSILESEAYKRKLSSAKASIEKNKELLKKAGIIKP